MQTIEENKINYFVFPYETFSSGSLPSGSLNYFLYAYETMANDSANGDGSLITLRNESERWRIASTYVESTNSDDNNKLFLRAGTTYEIELRFGVVGSQLWGTTTSEWIDTINTWSYDEFNFDIDNSVLISQDRAFCSGSVSPNQKIYISSNEDAVMTIYQG